MARKPMSASELTLIIEFNRQQDANEQQVWQEAAALLAGIRNLPENEAGQ